jgi:hypothetical protein
MKIYWRGLTHDLSKFFPKEFIPYANYFYGNNGETKPIRNKTGYYKSTETGDEKFDRAWMHHQHHNAHHWQYWGVIEDDTGIFKPIKIDHVFLLEMICDWVGAGKAQGHFSPRNDKYFETRKWYIANHKHMTIHPESKKEIEKIIGFPPGGEWTNKNER